MDNLDRLRKVLDFEGSLRHDPADRYEDYYPTVIRRLSGRDLVIEQPLPEAASHVATEPIGRIDVEAAAALVPEEPLTPLVEEARPARKGRGRKAKVVDVIATPVEPIVDAPAEPAAEPMPEPTAVAVIDPQPDAGFEDEIEFLPFRGAVKRPEELLEFEELWVDPGGQPSAELVPETPTAAPESPEPTPEMPPHESTAEGLAPEETVVAEAELTPSADPLTIEGYTLYAKRAHLRGGERTIHFFAREPSEGAVPASLPEGFEVERNPRSRLPYLRRIRPAKGAKSARRSKKRSKRNA